MAREDDIEPAGDAPPLKGLARDLETLILQCVGTFAAKAAKAAGSETEGGETLDQTMRTVALIARAALAVHALSAAEDKAAKRILDALADRMAAAVRAAKPNPDEGDETDMNERDPRLDTPDGVAEIRQDARQGLERLFRRLETKHAHRSRSEPPDGRGSGGAGEKLAFEGAPIPAAA